MACFFLLFLCFECTTNRNKNCPFAIRAVVLVFAFVRDVTLDKTPLYSGICNMQPAIFTHILMLTSTVDILAYCSNY